MSETNVTDRLLTLAAVAEASSGSAEASSGSAEASSGAELPSSVDSDLVGGSSVAGDSPVAVETDSTTPLDVLRHLSYFLFTQLSPGVEHAI